MTKTALAVSEPDEEPAASPETDWVTVTHKEFKDAEPGVVSREWLDGWGKAKGWYEVK